MHVAKVDANVGLRATVVIALLVPCGGDKLMLLDFGLSNANVYVGYVSGFGAGFSLLSLFLALAGKLLNDGKPCLGVGVSGLGAHLVNDLAIILMLGDDVVQEASGDV